MTHWIFEGQITGQAPAANEAEEPLSAQERCRREVVEFYMTGDGRRKVDVFGTLFRVLAKPAQTVHLITRDCQYSPRDPTCMKTRKKVQNAVYRLLRHGLVTQDDSGALTATAAGERFVACGVRVRAINLKTLRLPMQEVCEICEEDELPTTMNLEESDAVKGGFGGELTHHLPSLLAGWYDTDRGDSGAAGSGAYA